MYYLLELCCCSTKERPLGKLDTDSSLLPPSIRVCAFIWASFVKLPPFFLKLPFRARKNKESIAKHYL